MVTCYVHALFNVGLNLNDKGWLYYNQASKKTDFTARWFNIVGLAKTDPKYNSCSQYPTVHFNDDLHLV